MTKVKNKPQAPIIGADGNIFNIVGIAANSLRKEGFHEDAQEMAQRVYSSESYDDALSIILEYVDPVDAQEYNQDFGGMDYE